MKRSSVFTGKAPGRTALPASPLHGRVVAAAAWTGHSMIIWGGWAPNGSTSTPYLDGAIYTPTSP